MPHMAGDGGSLSYNDLHYQYIGIDEQERFTSGNSEDAQAFAYSTEPIEDRELDHNELAELVYLRRQACFFIQDDQANDQDQAGSFQGSVVLEVNSGPGEWLNSDQRFDVDNSFYSEENNRNLDVVEAVITPGYSNDTTQNGGPGSLAPAFERETAYAGSSGLFDHGPVLDPNDELDVRIELDAQNNIEVMKARVFYVLGWRVHEIEDARPQFGIPL